MSTIMKIAITGGKGFIGARLVKSLTAAGHQVVSIDLAEETPVDILDRQSLINAVSGCDVIYHLAAAHRDDISPRSIYYDVNGRGTKNVIDAAEANDIKRIIFTSTFAVYGLNTGTPDEQAKPAPFNDYGKSKLEAETHLKLWAAKGDGRSLTVVRPVVVFGPGNKGNVHTLISQIASKKFLMIGNGKNRKSMAYVENVVDFLQYCLTFNHAHEIYNYADTPDLDMNALTDIISKKFGTKTLSFSLPFALGLGAGYAFDGIAKITGKSFPISSVRIRKFCADTTCSAEKMKHSGFKPKYSLEDGLKKMIDADFPQPSAAKAA